MNLCSDNTAGVSPEILAALAACNEGDAMPYGNDPLSEKVLAGFDDLFETKTATFLTATGTSANALALATLTPPWGSILCHREAHIECDECGAPEMYTAGAKLVLLDGDHARIDPAALASHLEAQTGAVHHVQPRLLSLTQLTEAGTCYSLEHIRQLTDMAHKHGLKVHMDGARFANALAHLDVTPAQMTWQAGIDVLSFGATKNGAMCAEAVVFFDPDLAGDFAFRRKRAGHLFSKMRYLAAQWMAMLENDLWLANARHANAMAKTLADSLQKVPGCELCHPVDGNEIFVRVNADVIAQFDAQGVLYYRWIDGPTPVLRLVSSFNTPEDKIAQLAARLAG